MAGNHPVIRRNRRSLFYQFPLRHIVRNPQTNLYERVLTYTTVDPEDPTRKPPAPPNRKRLRTAVEELASRFPSTAPSIADVVESFMLEAPMAAETVTAPATFYCTSCGRVNHVDSGSPEGAPSRILDSLRDCNGGSLWICVKCRGTMAQWQFRTVHPLGKELPSLESPAIRCRRHGTRSLRLNGFHNNQLRDWIVTCQERDCGHRARIRGHYPSKADVAALPKGFERPFRVRPIGASNVMMPRFVALPFSTAELRPPEPGTLEASNLIAKVTAAANAPPRLDWRSRPSEEQAKIFALLTAGDAATPEEAESKLIRLRVLKPIHTNSGDPRANVPEALEQARIIEKVRREGEPLQAPPTLRVTSHSRMPVSTVLVGYTYNATDPRECVLRFYTQKVGMGTRPTFYYHTGDAEGLLVEFDESFDGDESYVRLHTWTHALIRALGERSGHGEAALAEHLLPHFRSALIYPTESTELVLGLLKRAWDEDHEGIIARAEEILQTCPGDPFCSRHHGACGQCVMLPVHTCRDFNAKLARPGTEPDSPV